MATSKDKREPCRVCGCQTLGEWCGYVGDSRRQTVALCGDCVNELIDDYGDEFPEELADDLPPDDINER